MWVPSLRFEFWRLFCSFGHLIYIFIAMTSKTEWCIGKHSCLGTRGPGFKPPYCQKSFFSFKSWWRNSKICDQDAISIWPPLDSWVNAILIGIYFSSRSKSLGFSHCVLTPFLVTWEKDIFCICCSMSYKSGSD